MLRFTYHFKHKRSLISYLCYPILRYYTIKYGYDIPYQTQIGPGFRLIHFGAIAINPLAVIGSNVTIFKDVTIGSNRRGKNQGSPTIGDGVFVGANASIIGNCKIGDNSMIAPNSFVNFDVPANSLVIGNPGKIIPVDDATLSYRDNFI
ncbi:MAG: serine acetyltransferase [Crocinitomicaceae bacterium]|nr:serine acetyltransferase [Crocinitomicaceae bacterium]